MIGSTKKGNFYILTKGVDSLDKGSIVIAKSDSNFNTCSNGIFIISTCIKEKGFYYGYNPQVGKDWTIPFIYLDEYEITWKDVKREWSELIKPITKWFKNIFKSKAKSIKKQQVKSTNIQLTIKKHINESMINYI